MSDMIELDNGVMRCAVLSRGARLQSLLVPDRRGFPVDVVLGCDSAADYEKSPDYMGAVVGRYANRIAGASFPLNGEIVRLGRNYGRHHIHGGRSGFTFKDWNVLSQSRTKLTLGLESPDGDEGYPGRMAVRATYELKDLTLRLLFEAVSDKDTVCSLTGHSYFNLAGHRAGQVLDQTITIDADRYLPADHDGFPIEGEADVAATPMDLRKPVPIGLRINDDFWQLSSRGGFDHCYVLNGPEQGMKSAARAACGVNGIALELLTDYPALQFYTANGLAEGRIGKGGARYGRWQAFCLEPAFFPDAPNRPAFPSPFLRAGELYRKTIDYRFSHL